MELYTVSQTSKILMSRTYKTVKPLFSPSNGLVDVQLLPDVLCYAGSKQNGFLEKVIISSINKNIKLEKF